jgi:type II secretory ATPase GspE/PulE/Tfp pilus assembly ATPase PilB-like protein
MGRIGIFEVMPITEKLSKLILQKSDANTIEEEAKHEGMITMKQDGFLKVIEGLTTIDEILRVAEE